MRLPLKRMQLYERMKSDITAGFYQHGAFLPNEFELATKYGYSRDTVRSVLAMLEEDNLVELLKGKRRRIPPAVVEKKQIPLTFLLPCADFFSEIALEENAQTTRRMLSGVSRIAFKYNRRVETVSVSPTNDFNEIDWRTLDFINADSLVMIAGSYWYCGLFPLFKERGCKIAFVENQTNDFNIYADYLKDWFLLKMDRASAVKAAVQLLAKRGCRRIALIHTEINENGHPVLAGYKAGIEQCSLNYAAWQDTTDENVAEKVADFYKKNKFDALLLDPFLIFKIHSRQSLNHCLGFPENVKIITTDEINYNHLVHPALSSIAFPYEEIGQVAARYLLDEDSSSGEHIFSAKIIERESTMHENKQSVLEHMATI